MALQRRLPDPLPLLYSRNIRQSLPRRTYDQRVPCGLRLYPRHGHLRAQRPRPWVWPQPSAADSIGVQPRGVPIEDLQSELLKAGQHIPGLALHDADDLARTATVTDVQLLRLGELPPCGAMQPLDVSRAMLLPVAAGRFPL